jgi:hypothetical protein
MTSNRQITPEAKKQEDERAGHIQPDSSIPQRTRSRPQMGDPIQTALNIFREACKEPSTLFITDEWIQPRLEALEAALSDPITSEQAGALCDAIEKSAKLDHVIEWLQVSLLPWMKFLKVKKEFEDKLRALRNAQHDLNYQLEYLQEEMEWRTRAETHWEAAMHDRPLQSKHDAASAVREYGHLSHPCPKCGAVKVRWFYYVTPRPSDKSLISHGFAGWQTACAQCRVEIDFFPEVRVYF